MSDFFKTLEQPFGLLNEYAFEANRGGEITPAQQKQIKSLMGWNRVILLILVTLVVGGFFGFLLFTVILDGSWQRDKFAFLLMGGIFLAAVFYMGFGILRQLYRNIKLQRDLDSRAIRQGQGQIVHGRKGYGFEMSGSHLRMPADQSGGLLPGTMYQVYYLEESGMLLSATSSYQANTNQARMALNEILASVHRFSADDLLANKQGEVTFAQRSKLFFSLFLGLGLMLAALLIFVLLLTSAPSKGAISFMVWIIIILIILPIAGAVVLMKALLDIVSPKLAQVQGLVMKERRVVNTGKNSHVEYNYVINNLRFPVNYRAYTALVDGLQYRIYYLSRSKKLIAIEMLNDALDHQTFAPKI